MAAAQLSRRSPAQISISRTSKALAGVDLARARVFFAVADRGPGAKLKGSWGQTEGVVSELLTNQPVATAAP